jgi:NAD dependent epimerase/dehydratase family enzyme
MALDDPRVVGALNGCAPAPCTMSTFAQGIGRALHRPAALPVPGFVLRAAFGEGARVLLEGQRVVPRRALELGYRFRFPDLDSALADLLGTAPAQAVEAR